MFGLEFEDFMDVEVRRVKHIAVILRLKLVNRFHLVAGWRLEVIGIEVGLGADDLLRLGLVGRVNINQFLDILLAIDILPDS